MARYFLKSTKHNGLKFEIVELDKATKKATLKGDTGVPFPIELSAENLKKYGYEVVKSEEPDHELAT